MRNDVRQAGIVEGQGRPSERPVLTISGSGEGGRKRGGTPDVPREGRKTESGGQLLTVLTRMCAGETRARQEEIRDGRSRAGGSERSKEPQTETRGELSNISSEVVATSTGGIYITSGCAGAGYENGI